MRAEALDSDLGIGEAVMSDAGGYRFFTNWFSSGLQHAFGNLGNVLKNPCDGADRMQPWL